ncbi:MAG TPA: glycosyltransferase family 9 protein [Rhodocyclaceae bacterium]|nr:glycosyltransferase family 9 protein [Rhodocyclaceae bacterium]
MKKILVIRRDNIGDLVCTTPMIHMLRQAYPDAWIGVLATSYNVAVLDRNPDADEVFRYRKAKHRGPGESVWGIWLETAGLLWRLRRRGIDLAIAASPGGERYARSIAARQIISEKPSGPMHEVERCAAMLKPLGIEFKPGPLVLVPDQAMANRLAERSLLKVATGRRIAVHISARRPAQRWPGERFVELIRNMLQTSEATQVMLFWSPGAQDDPAHPGDDEKLAEIMAGCAGDSRVIPMRTSALAELIAGLSLCDVMVCSDGGAMHIAAGLGKPIICMFGDSDDRRWHPWGVPHQVLRPDSHNVMDVHVSDVLAALKCLPLQALG